SITYDQGDGSTELATTSYTYDPLTFRLTYFKTTRPGTPAKLLQSLAYHYDAVGNIVKTVDSMSEDVYFTTAPSDPADADYTYDAVYRLIEATSREHGSITGVQDDQDDVYNFKPIPHGNNPDEFREYTQTYEYDKVGNLTKMVHAPTGASNWTRNYTYPSTSNRLSSIDINGGTSLTYTHDAHGNITDIPHLDAVNWDYADQMSHVEISSDQDVYFSYDASGRRVRKVWITNSGNLRRERIYLGGFEVWRRYDKVGGNWVLDDERETVHISDDHRRICMIETLTWEGGSAPTTITPRYRFQFDNHLGTACVETDETGAVISYEEYHPYGTSSYRSWKTGVEVSAKRYRYTGKERDEETSLYYHGARYYAPWLGRWMSADPAGTVDGTNLFAYVRGSPVVLSDPSGTQGSYFGNENQTPARPPTPEEQYAEISERWGSSSSSEAAPGPEPSEEAAGATLTESSLDRPPPLPKGEPATGLGIEPLGEGHVSDGSGGAPPNPPSAGLGGGPEGTHDAARQEFDPEEAAAKIGAVVTLWHYYAARAQIAAAWTFQTIFVPQEAWNQPPTEPQGDDDDSLRDQAKRLHRPHLGMSPPGRPSAEEIPVLTERQARTASSTGYYTEWVGDRKTGRAVVRKAPKKYRVDIPAGSVADSAQALGFGRRIPPQRAPFDSHGQAVFFDGRRYISRDVDSHVGGVWKMFDRRGRRLGTYDANLNRIGN
ncbi:MAG: RHS repeat-associated core domain-containing protein, partial [Polyangiaceae bacterium]